MNEISLSDHSREECVVLMTLLHLENLVRNGFMTSGAIRISDKGRAVCERLKNDGFEFNPGELEGALSAIQKECETS